MSLETIYYTGQTIAVIAILLSLIMIVIEQRRKNAADRGVTLTDVSKQIAEFTWRYTQDEDLLEAIKICLNAPDRASRNQHARFHWYMLNLMQFANQVYNQNKYQIGNPESTGQLSVYVASNLKTPGGLQWWKTVAVVLWPDELVAHLQPLIDQNDGSVPVITDIVDHLRLEPKAVQTVAAAPESSKAKK